MTTFALPRTAVAVRLQLTHGAPRTGEIFLFERVPQHSGPETPLEMLNRPEGFFPFRAEDRKSTRLNSSHSQISYAVFCLKKKKKDHEINQFVIIKEAAVLGLFAEERLRRVLKM